MKTDREPIAPQPQEVLTLAAPGPGSPILRAGIRDRAQTWLDAQVPYSQSRFRDGYRTDCSGFVSMAWQVTGNFWTGNLETIGERISYRELQTGDMLLFHNRADPHDGSHVVLFDRWVGAPGGDFIIFEQCKPHTLRRKWPDTPHYSRADYKPFRYRNLVPEKNTEKSEEETMPTFQSWEIKPGYAFDDDGKLLDASSVVLATIPPVSSGKLPWGPGWISFGCDFGKVSLRVAVLADGAKAWKVFTVEVDGAKGRGATSTPLPKGAGKISVGRIRRNGDPAAENAPTSMLFELGYRG